MIKVSTSESTVLMTDAGGIFPCLVIDADVRCETGIWSLSFRAYPTERGLAAAREGRKAFLERNPGWPVSDHTALIGKAIPELASRIV